MHAADYRSGDLFDHARLHADLITVARAVHVLMFAVEEIFVVDGPMPIDVSQVQRHVSGDTGDGSMPVYAYRRYKRAQRNSP